jgi:hypothetical protein
MKKVLFLGVIFMSLISCGNNDDQSCTCESQRYERSAVRSTSHDNALISASEWVKVGAPTPSGTDCDSNGSTRGSGSFNAYQIDATKYGVQEYENRITCK